MNLEEQRKDDNNLRWYGFLTTGLIPRPVRAIRVTRGGLEPSAIARIFPTSLTGDVVSEIAEDDWERGCSLPKKRKWAEKGSWQRHVLVLLELKKQRTEKNNKLILGGEDKKEKQHKLRMKVPKCMYFNHPRCHGNDLILTFNLIKVNKGNVMYVFCARQIWALYLQRVLNYTPLNDNDS